MIQGTGKTRVRQGSALKELMTKWRTWTSFGSCFLRGPRTWRGGPRTERVPQVSSKATIAPKIILMIMIIIITTVNSN